MDVQPLDPRVEVRLQAAPYTYEAVGHTATGAVPGFGWIERSATLRRRDFQGAVDDLLSWQVQTGSGMQVFASQLPLEPASVVLLRLGPGRLSLRIPCRVVHVVDEPDLKGFAYGTLPGHPVVGEERFVLRRLDDGRLELTISAFSRPASRLARLGGPVSRRMQHAMIGRYLRALDRGLRAGPA